MAVDPIPEGHPVVSPYLIVGNVVELLGFIDAVFDSEEMARTHRPDGSIMHAQVRLGGSIIMMGETEDGSQRMPGSLFVYVDDADAIYQRALDAGATSMMEPTDQFYGDRLAGVRDTNGNVWWIATHIEDVSAEEIERRANELNK